VLCPLCGQRKARRACPALSQQICAVCCGSKRLVQIQCPSDCPYLSVARDHPPAVVLRQQQHDFGLLVRIARDFNDRQSRLFVIVTTFLNGYPVQDLQPLIDDDVAETAAALAATFETASRGVLYEHRPASLPAERLASALKPVLVEAGKGGGTPFERDAAFVLRRIEEAVAEMRAVHPDNRRAFLDLVLRTMKKPAATSDEEGPAPPASRLIVP
jgi:hypothetical protein